MARTKVKVDDDVISKSEGPSSPSSSGKGGVGEKPLRLQTSLIPPATLIDELAELGFEGAASFVTKHDHKRIRQAIARAVSHPHGKIKNLPGYIRYLVITPGPIPLPEKSSEEKLREKYKQSRYANLVKG